MGLMAVVKVGKVGLELSIALCSQYGDRVERVYSCLRIVGLQSKIR